MKSKLKELKDFVIHTEECNYENNDAYTLWRNILGKIENLEKEELKEVLEGK